MRPMVILGDFPKGDSGGGVTQAYIGVSDWESFRPRHHYDRESCMTGVIRAYDTGSTKSLLP